LAGRLSTVEAIVGLIVGLAFFRSDGCAGYLFGLIVGTLVSTSLLAPLSAMRSMAATTGLGVPFFPFFSRAAAT
jgi:hypothetical protein